MMSAFRSGIMIVTAIQLFNWFPAKYYGTILSICLLFSPIGYFMQFLIGGFYKCFPDMPYFYFDTSQNLTSIDPVTGDTTYLITSDNFL